MTIIGAGWKKEDKNKKPYISISIDKELLPLTIDATKKISIFPIGDKQNEKAPDFRVNMFIPEEKEDEPKTDIWD
jgi:uncharacterized protein (DUF736 family)